MREIKVRAWDDVLGEMMHSKMEQFDDSLSLRFNKHFETENPIYSLYTGLKDINGKELFFDDVIKVWHYRRDTFDRWVIESYSDLFDLVAEKQESGAKFEILGNKYDNPELLD